MSISDVASLVGGAALGAPFGELLKLVIEEAKKVKAFKSLFKKLASTMEKFIPIAEEIDSLYGALDLQKNELKDLIATIKTAEKLVKDCSKVSWFDVYHKSMYTRKIQKTNQELLDFLQTDMQLLILKNLLQSMCSIESVNERISHMSTGGKEFRRLCSAPELETVTIGLDWPLKKLKKRLAVEGTSTLVVSAPPGCGKTTLVTKLCHDKEIKGKFKKIFFITVSKTPNVRLIVQNLLQHNGYNALAFEDNSAATLVLQQLLKQIGGNGPMLIVLDDVWDGADSLVASFAIRLPGYKLLVTSRSEFPSLGPTYRLEPLKAEDARALFIKWASEPYHSSHTDFEDLLANILKRCNGFPLAIKVVGSSLNGRSLSSWKSLAIKWSNGDKIINTPKPDVLECLQSSIDALSSDLKECFLDMCSFLEDQKIRASTIIDMWVELYHLEDDVVAMKCLEDLSSHNLLNLVALRRIEHEDGFYNECMITQHDILRELSIYNSELEPLAQRKRLNLEIRNNRLPEWCLNLRQPLSARLLSISTDDLFSSKWRDDMQFPEVEALVLNLSSTGYALPEFITGMKKLTVLTVTNHGFFAAKVSNFSYVGSLSNLRRIRLEKVSLDLLDISELKLESLDKLSMVMCDMGEVFYDFEMDVSGALPSLREIDIDFCSSLDELPYWICQVVSLKKLSVTNCNNLSRLPEAIGRLKELEVLRLSSCIGLSELPDAIVELGNLRHLDVSECMGLARLPCRIGELRKLKKMSMRKCKDCELPESLRKLENLEVRCDEETAFLWTRLEPCMRNLTVHVQEDDPSLKWLNKLI